MELRLLMTELERQEFAKCLTEARATRGIGWREIPHSHLGEAHLTFGSIYGIFDSDEEPRDRMIAGFIMHDLSTFPQSLSRPDLSHLPATSVLEGSELWSLSRGAARVAAVAAAVVAGMSQAKAILLYPMLRPVDLGTPYTRLNFVNVREPVLWPYAKTIGGDEIWVQPMILQGEKLEEYIRSGFEFLFKNREGRQVLRFDRPSPAPASAPTREVPAPRPEESTPLASAPAFDLDNGNGAASPNGAQR